MEERKLMYKIGGQMRQVQLYPVCYTYNRSLGMCLCKKGRDIDDEDTLTITRCLDAPQTKNCVYIDVNNCGPEIIQWLEKNKLGKLTGREAQSDYVTYPEFMLDESVLQEYTNEHFAQYLQWQEELNEDQEFLIRSCNMCNQEFPLIVSKKAAAQYREYEQGAPYLIQNIFPELSNGERGLLARGQGMCDKCFKQMFGSF